MREVDLRAWITIRRVLLIACLSLIAVQSRTAIAGVERGDRFALAHVDLSRSEAPGVLALELDGSGYQKLLTDRRVVVEAFPLPDRVAVDLELAPFEVLAHDARFVIVDDQGERDVPRPRIHSFRGSVIGDPDSVVTLNALEGRISGSIRTWDGEFVIAPRDYNLAQQGSRDIRVWNRDVDPDAPDTPLCGALPESTIASDSGVWSTPQSVSAIDENTLLKAGVAIDATYEWYSHFGSVSAAQNYILNLLAQVATIYENEVLVQLEVAFLRIHTTSSDPYTDTTDTAVLLSELREEWNANQSGIARTAVHLFSIRPGGGAGRAYVDVLCSNDYQPGNSNDYGVTTVSANGGSWEKNLLAHELGHNFSSPHTHCYSPEIDQCANENGCYQGPINQTTGTIMSYCNQQVSSFHPRAEDEQIRPAAEAAFPTCISTAGLPGRVEAGNGIMLSRPNQCPTASLENDDGSVNGYFGYSGTTQMAWIKRFTPSCYPFLLEEVQVQIGHASTVAAGRAVRVLVYTDPQGTGDPFNATLTYSEDVVVQSVSNSVLNEYVLAVPQTLASGDYYIGLYDLVGDAETNYIADVDSSTVGDSYRTGNSTQPQAFALHGGGTWMIRGAGGAVGADSLELNWGLPCNDATTPSQDYSIYAGAVGDYGNYSSMTCTTGRETHYLAANTPEDSFFLVVPNTTANEGSYGTDSAGVQRAPAAAACKVQSAADCP